MLRANRDGNAPDLLGGVGELAGGLEPPTGKGLEPGEDEALATPGVLDTCLSQVIYNRIIVSN